MAKYVKLHTAIVRRTTFWRMNKNLFKAPKNIYKWEFEKGRQTRSEKQTEEEKKIEDRNEKRKKNRINIVEIPVFVGLPVVM